MQQQNNQEISTNPSVKFVAGMTLNQYMTQLQKKSGENGNEPEQSESDIQVEPLDRFQIKETDEDKEDEELDNRQGRIDRLEQQMPYSTTQRSPYCFNFRLHQFPNQKPIHELMHKKNFRISKKGQSQSPQKNLLNQKGVDLFRSLYGNHFKQPQPIRVENLHSTLYSKSIFPRIDQRPGYRKPISLNKRPSRNQEGEMLLQEHLLSTRQLLKLRGFPTEGPPQALDMRIDGVKDKYYQRKAKSKSIKRY